MQADVRDTDLYREVERLYRLMNEPFGEVASAADVSASPDGARAAFTGLRRDAIENDPLSRVCVVDLANGEATMRANSERIGRLVNN